MSDDFEVQRKLQDELDSGEKIAWQQKAKPRFLGMQTVLPGLFAIVWLLIVGTSMFSQFHGRSLRTNFFPFLPFAVVGIAFVVIPFVRFLNRTATYYLLTNRRVLIISLGRTKKVLSYYPDKLQSLERRERAGGVGDLVIDRSTATGVYQRNSSLQEIGFMNIADVKRVESMVRALAAGPK